MILLLLLPVVTSTTFYLSPSFLVHEARPPAEGAMGEATFVDSLTLNGWTKLWVSTNASYPDEVQSRAAGVLEGVITADRILQVSGW